MIVRVTVLLVCLSLAALARAHGTVCLANNDQTAATSGATTAVPVQGGAAVHAWRFVPARTTFPRAALLFTGSPLRDDYMRLEVWSDANGAPGTPLMQGAVASPRSVTAAWLGTNFDGVGQLVRDTAYWFVWVEPGDSIVPEEPGGATLPYRQLGANGTWTAARPSPVKLRLFCGDTIDTPAVLRVGSSCLTSSGSEPAAWSNEEPLVGNAAFRVEGVHLPAGSDAWLLIGFTPSWGPLALDLLLGAPPLCLLYTNTRATLRSTVGVSAIGAGPASFRPAPSGHVLFELPIPADQTLPGTVAVAQIITVDSGAAAALPIVATNALQISISP